MNKIKFLLLALLLTLGLTACEPPPERGVVVASYPTSQIIFVNKVPIITWYSNVQLDNGYFIYQADSMALYIQCQVGETWLRGEGCPS